VIMNCSMTGWFALPSGPSGESSTGTVRKPLNFMPSLPNSSAITSLQRCAFAASRGRNIMPRPRRWRAGRGLGPAVSPKAPCCSSSFQGIAVMMPEPSPLTLSDRQAPRCSMQPRARRPAAMILWLDLASAFAMKPTPQASLSPTSHAGPAEHAAQSTTHIGHYCVCCKADSHCA
jgi:hypothetical protein